MASVIIEEKDEEHPWIIDVEAQELNIRQIIEYQKSLYYSSSSLTSFYSTGASCSSFSSPCKSSSLLDLMKEGSTSLRRLFDMEHKSLENYLKDYSGLPIIKPILLCGSEADDGIHHDDPLLYIKRSRAMVAYRSDGQSGMASEDSIKNRNSLNQNKLERISKRRLTRTKSFRRLPRYRLWIYRGFRFRLRLLRRLRIIICGRKL